MVFGIGALGGEVVPSRHSLAAAPISGRYEERFARRCHPYVSLYVCLSSTGRAGFTPVLSCHSQVPYLLQ